MTFAQDLLDALAPMLYDEPESDGTGVIKFHAGFETGSDGFFPGNTATLTRDATDPKAGSYRLRINCNPGDAGAGHNFSVDPNTTYTYWFWARSTTGIPSLSLLGSLGTDGAHVRAIVSGSIGTIVAAPTGNYQLFSFTFTTNATDAFLQFYIGAGAAGGGFSIDEVYLATGSVAHPEYLNGVGSIQGPLTSYLTGLALPYELIEEWVSDTDDHVGWSLLLDIDRCPDEALPWLAQFVGVKLNTGLSPADQRQQIEDLANWRRGTPAALQNAPLPYLTGTKQVTLRERYDGSGNDAPYAIEVLTLASETPDPVFVEKVIRSQKAAGLILTYMAITGQDLQHVSDTYATLQTIKDTFATLDGVRLDQAGV